MQYKQSTSVCFHVCFWDIARKHLHRLVGAESLRFLPFLNQQIQVGNATGTFSKLESLLLCVRSGSAPIAIGSKFRPKTG